MSCSIDVKQYKAEGGREGLTKRTADGILWMACVAEPKMYMYSRYVPYVGYQRWSRAHFSEYALF